MVKFCGITSDIPVEISCKIWWYTSGILVVYQWKLAVKFGGITSGKSVVYQWNIGGVTSGIPVEISGKIWWYYHCYPLI